MRYIQFKSAYGGYIHKGLVVASSACSFVHPFVGISIVVVLDEEGEE
jgi:hypothetical protein